MKLIISITLLGMGITACLLYLFPPEPFWLFMGLMIGSVLSAGFGVLAFSFQNSSRFWPALFLLILAQIYVLIWVAPTDIFGSDPHHEIRTAIASSIQYDNLNESVFFKKPEPPFALITAGTHRFRDELPEYSWDITFIHPGESGQEDHLLNIRNDIVGFSYPSIIHAVKSDSILTLTAQHNDLFTVTYEIPLDFQLEENVIMGTIDGDDSDDSFILKTRQHLLKPKQEMRFQVFFDHILDFLK